MRKQIMWSFFSFTFRFRYLAHTKFDFKTATSRSRTTQRCVLDAKSIKFVDEIRFKINSDRCSCINPFEFLLVSNVFSSTFSENEQNEKWRGFQMTELEWRNVEVMFFPYLCMTLFILSTLIMYILCLFVLETSMICVQQADKTCEKQFSPAIRMFVHMLLVRNASWYRSISYSTFHGNSVIRWGFEKSMYKNKKLLPNLFDAIFS